MIYNVHFSSFGNFYLSTNGQLFDNNQKEIKPNKRHYFFLKGNKGQTKTVSLKKLYRTVYNKEFCFNDIQSLKGERWQPIADTNHKYFVSNFGRIKSLCGYHAKLLKPYLQKTSGYLEIKINGKNRKVHQLVAFAFCENKHNSKQKIEVHHKDKNRLNNNADNLEILTVEEHHKRHKKEVVSK